LFYAVEPSSECVIQLLLSLRAALFQAAYPSCWKTHKACDQRLTDSVSYSQIAGIIVGMLSVGFIADRIGRKWGSVMTASVMFTGALRSTAQSAHKHQGFASDT
jgi:MFS family permease